MLICMLAQMYADKAINKLGYSKVVKILKIHNHYIYNSQHLYGGGRFTPQVAVIYYCLMPSHWHTTACGKLVRGNTF